MNLSLHCLSNLSRRWLCLLLIGLILLSISSPLHAEQKEVTDLSAFFKDYLGEDAKKEKFEFAVISDTHVCGQEAKAKAFRALLERIKAVSTPDCVVIVGDLTEGKKEHFQELFRIFREVMGDKVKLLPSLGNHDKSFSVMMDGLYDVHCSGNALGANYSVDYGKLHFTFLTCIYNGLKYPGAASTLDFLKKDLGASASRPTLLFQHIPIFSPITNDAYLTSLGADRYAALDLLKGCPFLKTVVSGHTHTFFACRYYDKTFLSSGGGRALTGDAWISGWYLFKADGEKYQTLLETGNKQLTDLSDPQKIPLFKTPMADVQQKKGWTEIPLFTETCDSHGTLGNSAEVTGAIDGITPVAGTKMLVATEKNKFPSRFRTMKYPPANCYDAYDAILTYGDFKLEKGDRLSYWIFVPAGADVGPVGVIIPGIDFSKLKDTNGIPAIVDLKKDGLSTGNWLYREIPLGDSADWYSATQFAGPGSFQTKPGPFKIFLDEIRILRGEPTKAPNQKTASVTNVRATQTGATFVLLEWSTVPGAHHYHVYREEGDARRFIGATNQAHFRDLTADAKKSYKYDVRAVSRESGESDPATISVTTAEKDPATQDAN